jgi:hypothetical protein
MKKKFLCRLAAGLALLLMLSFLLLGVSRLDAGYANAGKAQLEEALRRASVACYATEGRYPPSLAYLTEHYGVQVDEARYTVFYEVVAENWMPEITVLEKNV